MIIMSIKKRSKENFTLPSSRTVILNLFWLVTHFLHNYFWRHIFESKYMFKWQICNTLVTQCRKLGTHKCVATPCLRNTFLECTQPNHVVDKKLFDAYRITTTTLGNPKLWSLLTIGRCSEVDPNWDSKMVVVVCRQVVTIAQV